MEGSQNFKSRSLDPITAPFELILHFCLRPLVANPYAKFEVSSFNRSRDMEGPKILKVGHVTLHDPF